MKKSAKWFDSFLIFGALSLCVCPVLSASNNFSKDAPRAKLPPLETPLQNLPLEEHLFYRVSWMGIPVGVGQLWVREKASLDGRDCLHVVAIAETSDFLSKIYPVRDEVHSWIDEKTLQSLQFEKKVSEGRYRADERVRYDGTAGKGYYESLKNGGKKEFSVHTPVHDIVSAFYWARRQELTPGRAVQTIVNSDEKDWDLKIQVLGREQKEIHGHGEMDTILIEPKTSLKGVLEKRGRVWIHLKNDRARTPVLITFNTPFGRIAGVLQPPE